MTYTNKFDNAPYNDDFDESKNFVKVLFKPAVTVQTREINQLQTSMQNQTSKISDYLFQNSTFVTKGEVDTYKADYVKIDAPTFDFTLCTNAYFVNDNGLVSKCLYGINNSTEFDDTLYIKYLNSTPEGNVYEQDTDLLQLASVSVTNITGSYEVGETITGNLSGTQAYIYNADYSSNVLHIKYYDANRFIINDTLVGNTASSTFLTELSDEETVHIFDSASVSDVIGTGRLASIAAGTYYFNGYFVDITEQTIVVEAYGYMGDYVIGLYINEKVITANDDSSLFDNAAGFLNENAPGADRYNIEGVLGSINLFEEKPENFFTILTVQDNIIIKDINQDKSQLDRKLADRTFEESGNYILNQPSHNIYDFTDIYTVANYTFDTQVEALNFALEKFDIIGAFTIGGFWYPCNDQTELDNNIESHYIIYFQPNVAYIKGNRYNYESIQEVVAQKTRDTEINENVTTIESTTPWMKVETIANLPDITNLETVNILDIGDAQIGTCTAINFDAQSTYHRFYAIDIVMDSGKTFETDAKKLSSVSNFTAEIIQENSKSVLYDTDTNLLIQTQFKSVKDITDIQFNNKKYATATASGGTGTFTIAAEAGETFLPYDDTFYTVTDSSGNLIDLTGKVFPAPSLLTIILGAAYDTQNVELIYTVLKANSPTKTKTLTTDVNQAEATPTDEIEITKADIYRIAGIYDSGDIGTPATISDTDITDNYILDDGQRPYFYDYGKITLKDGYNAPSGQILIVYDYFLHSAGDYFTRDSYSIPYGDIPSYTGSTSTIDLTDAIDFRQLKDTGIFDIVKKSANILNNTITQYDVEYYLPRKDYILIDSLGNLNIKYGHANAIPNYPIINTNNILVFKLDLQPYVKTIKDIDVQTVFKRRYTMEDIGDLEERLNYLESFIKNISSNTSSDNIEINNIFSDDLTKFNGDVTNKDYKSSINLKDNILYAYSTTYNCNAEVDTQSNITVQNDMAFLPYTELSYINSSTPNTSIKIIDVNKDKNTIVVKLEQDTLNTYDLDKEFKDNTINQAIEDNNYIFDSPINNWIGTKDD